MAKISARGATAIARADRRDDDVRVRLVLRSDGAILRAVDVGASRGGFSVAAKIKPTSDKVAVFNSYATRRGFNVA